MKDIYYVNSRNTKISFSEWPFAIEDVTALFKKIWECSSTANKTSNSSKLDCFYRTELETTVNIQVFADDEEEFRDCMNTLMEATEIDIIDKTPGKLYCNGYYLMCYIANIEPGEYEELFNAIDNSAKILSLRPFWIKEQKLSFNATPSASAVSDSSSGLDFPFDFPFDFAPEEGTEYRTVDHYAPSHFQMLVYGPCVNPKITINGYPRQVFTTLESNEYMIIDSRENSVTKYLSNGTTQDLYNSRQFAPSIFEKIPGGKLTFIRSGTFGYEITFYLERSEPKW